MCSSKSCGCCLECKCSRVFVVAGVLAARRWGLLDVQAASSCQPARHHWVEHSDSVKLTWSDLLGEVNFSLSVSLLLVRIQSICVCSTPLCSPGVTHPYFTQKCYLFVTPLFHPCTIYSVI